MDWVPTILEAAGVAPHPDYPPDGRSLLAVLRNPRRTFARELFWKMLYRNQKAMRARHAEWERSLPVFPDAAFSVISGKSDLARPSG